MHAYKIFFMPDGQFRDFTVHADAFSLDKGWFWFTLEDEVIYAASANLIEVITVADDLTEVNVTTYAPSTPLESVPDQE